MKKLYYSIGEVSELIDAEAHMLRYWETKITRLQPKKNKRGKRLYTEEDVTLCQQLKELIVDQGYSVDGARKALESPSPKSENPLGDDIKRDLAEIRQFLHHLQEQL